VSQLFIPSSPVILVSLLMFIIVNDLLSIYLGFFYSHPSPSVLIPALRTVGNIVTGDDIQTQVQCTSLTKISLHNLNCAYPVLQNKCFYRL
jgi:hypothetical protein